MSTKPTNPKDAIATYKVPLHLVSGLVKAYQALAHYLGNVKYGAWNYRAGGARASVYKAACERHLDRWFEGEELDPVDGTPHLANALACINILIETKHRGNLVDDRPPSTNLTKVYEEIERTMQAIHERYKDRKPRHYTIADTVGDEDGPGEEDGPWAAGWAERSSGAYGSGEHTEVLRAAGIHVEGDGGEHGEIMREILG